MKQPLSILFFFLLLSFPAFSQQRFTLSGTVREAATGETLIGTVLRVVERPEASVASNEYGFFSLTLPAGNYMLVAQSNGYEADTLRVNLNADITHDFALQERAIVTREAVVFAERSNSNVVSTRMGAQRLEMTEINQLPVLFGERDILKSIQLLPGVKTTSDGMGGVFVRGGAGDQNLMLLDEAVVYNASHAMGFFSTFNSDAIKDVSLYKGTQAAEYGGRLSSVMDVRMKEGNNQRYEANGSLGLISSKLSVEGPIVKDKGSFLVSGRRTYADVFLLFDERFKGTSLYFYDINLKANYRIGKKDALYLSGFFGRDKMALKELGGIDWGNITGTLRWNHIINRKFFSNTSFIVSDYSYKITVDFDGTDFAIHSNIRDFQLKQAFHYYISPKNTLKFGFDLINHDILPGEVSSESNAFSERMPKQYSVESALFVQDEWKIAPWLNINAGVRLSTFFVLSGGDFYTLNNDRTIADTTHYASGKLVKAYINPEPRVNASFIIDDKNSIKLSFTRNTQYLHLLSNSTTASPTDRWVATDNNIAPEQANQYSVGYFCNFLNDKYQASAEFYYKDMFNQLDYKDYADVLSSTQVATQLLVGKGRAYGAEFYLKKTSGKLTGWISYTLSRTERQIDGVNSGKWYPARQDKTHDISVVATYALNKRISFSASWVYSTGNAVTFPTGKYYIDNRIVWLYTERNGYRMPAYHRLDIGMTWKLRERKHFSSELTFGVYNVYGRENAFAIRFRENETDPTRTEVVQTALFRFIPSVSWNFKIK